MNRIQPSSHLPHFHAARISSLLPPLIAFGAGFYVMFSRIGLSIPPQWAQYLSLAVLAGLDSVLGGVRAGMEGRFQSDIFLSGFVVNIIFAVLIAWFGDVIGLQDVYLVAILVFGWRIFLNISIIRRFFIERVRSERNALDATLAPDAAAPRAAETTAGTDVVGA